MNLQDFRIAAIRAKATNRGIAEELGLSEQALYNKLNGATEFKNSEIKKLANFLHLTMADVNRIFFNNEVN